MQPIKTYQITLFSSLVLLIFAACEPAVTFTEPQPSSIKSMSSIPRKMQGTYISTADSSTLIITPQVIRRVFDLNVDSDKIHLDSTSKVANHLESDSTVFRFSQSKKGTHLEVHYSDTLFSIVNDVLKKHKGYYFLNTKESSGTWVVNKANAQRNTLTISSISQEEDLSSLTKNKEEEIQTQHTFTTSKKQFNQFIKDGGFAENEVFIRID